MAVRIYGHHVKITNSLREYIESKLPRIEKYADKTNIQMLEVVLEEDGPQILAELRFKAGPMELNIKHKDTEATKVVDFLIDKAERSLKKEHDKMIGRKKNLKIINRNAKKADLSPDSEPTPLVQTEGPSLGNGHDKTEERDMPLVHEKLNIRIFRSPKPAPGRMTIHQAAEELFFRDENFLCFNNAETEGISILYRRKDGNFALMDAEGH